MRHLTKCNRGVPAGGLILMALLGCRATPEPVVALGPIEAPEAMSVLSEAYVGGILSGAVGTDWTPEEGTGWQAQVFWAERFPAEGLQSLASQWSLVTQPNLPDPVRGISVLTMGAQFAKGDRAEHAWQALQSGHWGRIGELRTEQGVLLPGTTHTIRWSFEEREEDPDNFLGEWPRRGSVRKTFVLALQAVPDGLQAAFALNDLGPVGEGKPEGALPPEGGRPNGEWMQEEWAIPRMQWNETEPDWLFVLPSPFEDVGAQAIVVRLSWIPADAGAVERLTQRLVDTQKMAQEVAALEVPMNQPSLRALASMQEEAYEGPWRGPLLYVANQGGGPLTRDLVLTADEDLMKEWVAFVPVASDLAHAREGAVHWALERAAWVVLARRQVKERLNGEWQALLLRHAGEVGHYPSTLQDAALQSADLETMSKRLSMENHLFLEDSNPGARVRAFDWLVDRNIDLSGFDPLGTKEDRRKALQALESAQDKQ